MLEVPTEFWECRICGVERPVPCQNTGPGVTACGQCGKPMTKRMPPLVPSTDVTLMMESAPCAPCYRQPPVQDPDTVMEPQEDDHHE